ncbi:MAG: response regulator [Peptostreptococcaceae bacterium]|jgi:two-component system response regulator (stage 0 sporulation protein F)|nr:response regulator [Peptostreptococcaceae bacterium]
MRKILAIDDEAGIRFLLKTVFEMEYSFFEASNIKDAFDIINSSEIDFIILDLNVDGQDGNEFFKIINKDYKNINFIIITGDESLVSEEIRLNSKLLNIYEKPFDLQKLKTFVDTYNA